MCVRVWGGCVGGVGVCVCVCVECVGVVCVGVCVVENGCL